MEFINQFFGFARQYNIDPLIYVALYIGSGIFIWPSVYLLVKIARNKIDKKYFIPAIVAFLFGWFLPYVYVLIWGENIHWAIKLGIIVICFATLWLYYKKKITKKKDS